MKAKKKITITGNSAYAEFIRQNIEEIVDRKVNMLNPSQGFLYFHPDGDFIEGRKSEYGQTIVAMFGGSSYNEQSAIEDLQYYIDTEPGGFNDGIEDYLKK